MTKSNFKTQVYQNPHWFGPGSGYPTKISNKDKGLKLFRECNESSLSLNHASM